MVLDSGSYTLKLSHNRSRTHTGGSGNNQNYDLCCPACCQHIPPTINQDSNSYNAINSLNNYLYDKQLYCDGDDVVTTPVLHWKLLYGKSPFQLASYSSPSSSNSSSPSPSVTDDADATHSKIIEEVVVVNDDGDDDKPDKTISSGDPISIKADHSNIECKSNSPSNIADINQDPVKITGDGPAVNSAETIANSTIAVDVQECSKLEVFMKHSAGRRLNKLARISSSRFVHHSPNIDIPSVNHIAINVADDTALAARHTKAELFPPHQALNCSCLHLMDYKTLSLKPETTTVELSGDTDRSEPISINTEEAKQGTEERVGSSGMASDQAAIISSLVDRLNFVEENQNRNSSMVSKLRLEVHDLSTRIQELEFSHASALREIHSLLQRFADQMTVSRRKEQEKIKMALVHMKEEMEEERTAWRLLKVQNKKLEKELADASMTAVDACEELEKERKARELLEEVCNELAKEIGEDKAEVEKLKKEQAKSREMLEEELKLMRMAVRWREERVRAKLSEAQCELDHGKQCAMSLQEVKSKLEAFVDSVGAAIDSELASASATSREPFFNQGLYGNQASMLRQGLELLHLHEKGAKQAGRSSGLETHCKNDAGINVEADHIAGKTAAQSQFVTIPSTDYVNDQVRSSISHNFTDHHAVNAGDCRSKQSSKKNHYKMKGGVSHASVPKQKKTILEDQQISGKSFGANSGHVQEQLKEGRAVQTTDSTVDVMELDTSTTATTSGEQKTSKSSAYTINNAHVEYLHQVPGGDVMLQNKNKSSEGSAKSANEVLDSENESEDFYFEPVMHGSDLNFSPRMPKNANSISKLSAELGQPKMKQGVDSMATSSHLTQASDDNIVNINAANVLMDEAALKCSGPIMTSKSGDVRPAQHDPPASNHVELSRNRVSQEQSVPSRVLGSCPSFRSPMDQGVGAYLFSKPAIPRGYQVVPSPVNSKQSSTSSSPWRRIPHSSTSAFGSGSRSPVNVEPRPSTSIFTDASRHMDNIPDKMSSLWVNGDHQVSTNKDSSNASNPMDNSNMMQHQSSTSMQSTTSSATSPISNPSGILKSNSLRAQLIKARELEAISAIVPPSPSPKPPSKLSFRFSPLRMRSTTS